MTWILTLSHTSHRVHDPSPLVCISCKFHGMTSAKLFRFYVPIHRYLASYFRQIAVADLKNINVSLKTKTILRISLLII
jgi:hypothetical protein